VSYNGKAILASNTNKILGQNGRELNAIGTQMTQIGAMVANLMPDGIGNANAIGTRMGRTVKPSCPPLKNNKYGQNWGNGRELNALRHF
jgi:hypothetical protein